MVYLGIGRGVPSAWTGVDLTLRRDCEVAMAVLEPQNPVSP